MKLLKNYRIILLLTLCLFGIGANTSARSSRGYIITQEHDTIFGRVRLPWSSNSIYSYNLFGFDFESFFYHVSFKKDSEKAYKTYYPTTISGFGFTHRSTNYMFSSFYLNYKSIFEDKGQGTRFLNLIHRGKLDLYRHMISINYPIAMPPFADRGSVMRFYEYYIWSDSTKLLWVGPKNPYKTLMELLVQCHVEDAYIRRLPTKTTFKDIIRVLTDYDRWIATSKSCFLTNQE